MSIKKITPWALNVESSAGWAAHWKNSFGGEAVSAVWTPCEQPHAGDVPGYTGALGFRVSELRAPMQRKGRIFPWISCGMRCRVSTTSLHQKSVSSLENRDPMAWFQRAQRAGMKRKLWEKHQGISCLIKKCDLLSKEWISSAAPSRGGCALYAPGCDSQLLSAQLLSSCPHCCSLSLLPTMHRH